MYGYSTRQSKAKVKGNRENVPFPKHIAAISAFYNETVQMKKISEAPELNTFNFTEENSGNTVVLYKGNNLNKPIDKPYEMKRYVVTGQNEVEGDNVYDKMLDKTREIIQSIGNIASYNKIQAKGVEGEQGTVPYADINRYEPFIARIPVKKGVKKLTTDVAYAKPKHAGYGYIVHIRKEGFTDYPNSFVMENTNEMTLGHGEGDVEYSKIHKSHEEGALQRGRLLENPGDADAYTQVVAEGARWNAVKELANRGVLKLESKFYATKDNEGNTLGKKDGEEAEEKYPYVEFQGLYVQWNILFKNRWAIPNNEIITTLRDKFTDYNKGQRGHETYEELHKQDNYCLN